ncbi:MAG: glutathione S-transferase family protein [Polyangiales bacterium]
MTYTLYWSPGTASLAVHWLLLELGVPHELSRVDLDGKQQKTDAYLKLNPNGVVPTLIVDGVPRYESAALVMLLAERHPEAGFMPAIGTAARADFLMWTMHLANTLQPAFRAWFYPEEPAGAANVDVAKAAARTRIEATWDRVAAHLADRTYMTGDAITALDFYTTMLMRWSRNMPKPATEWPAIAAYVARMKARPSFQTLYSREELTEWA